MYQFRRTFWYPVRQRLSYRLLKALWIMMRHFVAEGREAYYIGSSILRRSHGGLDSLLLLLFHLLFATYPMRRRPTPRFPYQEALWAIFLFPIRRLVRFNARPYMRVHVLCLDTRISGRNALCCEADVFVPPLKATSHGNVSTMGPCSAAPIMGPKRERSNGRKKKRAKKLICLYSYLLLQTSAPPGQISAFPDRPRASSPFSRTII